MDQQSWYARQQMRLVYRRGQILARQGNHQRAIAVLSKALVNHPDTAAIYVSRGLSHRELGQLEQAYQDFTTAIDCAENPAITLLMTQQGGHVGYISSPT